MLSLRNLKKTVWDISFMTREGKYLIFVDKYENYIPTLF